MKNKPVKTSATITTVITGTVTDKGDHWEATHTATAFSSRIEKTEAKTHQEAFELFVKKNWKYPKEAKLNR